MQKGLRIRLSKSDLYGPDWYRSGTVRSMKVPKFFEALKKLRKSFFNASKNFGSFDGKIVVNV